jgi:hypothetical protein
MLESYCEKRRHQHECDLALIAPVKKNSGRQGEMRTPHGPFSEAKLYNHWTCLVFNVIIIIIIRAINMLLLLSRFL